MMTSTPRLLKRCPFQGLPSLSWPHCVMFHTHPLKRGDQRRARCYVLRCAQYSPQSKSFFSHLTLSSGLFESPNGVMCLYHSPYEEQLGDYLEVICLAAMSKVTHTLPQAAFGYSNQQSKMTVMHSPLLGLHVYVFHPIPERDYFTLVTMGLSGFEMNPPSDVRSEYPTI
jgi:hypothetical protein